MASCCSSAGVVTAFLIHSFVFATNLARLVFVGDVLPPSNKHSTEIAEGKCASLARPCPSLAAAIDTLRGRASPDRNESDTVILLPKNSSSCIIDLGTRTPLTFRAVHGLTVRLAHLLEVNGCRHAVIENGEDSSDRGGVSYLEIVNSSLIEISGLHFLNKESSSFAVSVIQSDFVNISNCSFKLGHTSGGVLIDNSRAVLVDRVTFTPASMPDEREENSPQGHLNTSSAVKVVLGKAYGLGLSGQRFDPGNTSNSWTKPAEQEPVGNKPGYLYTDWQWGSSQDGVDGNDRHALNKIGVTMRHCYFHLLTRHPFLLHPDIMTGRRSRIGRALHVEVDGNAQACGCLLHVENVTFRHVVSQVQSPVYLKFSQLRTAPCSRYIHFLNCSFAKNIAAIGGGLVVHFTGPQNTAPATHMDRTLRVIIEKCNFTGNTAVKEGAALVLISEEQLTRAAVCLVVEDGWFRDNVAGVYGNQPGSAILSRGVINHHSSDPVYDTDDVELNDTSAATHACREQLEIHDTTFVNNTGYGALFLAQTRATLDNTSFINNTGTALVLYQSHALVLNVHTLIGNTGFNGGAAHLAEVSQIDLSGATEIVLHNNYAENVGCLFYNDLDSSAGSLHNLLYSSNHEVNPSRCAIQLPKDPAVWLTEGILKEKDLCYTRRKVAFYFTSFHTCWEAFQQIAASQEMPRTSTADNHLHKRPDQNCNLPYVEISGQCVQENGNAMSGLMSSSFAALLNRTDVCISTFQRIYMAVVNDLGVVKAGVGTNPSWMFLRGATTTCFKRIRDDFWYFRGVCSWDKIGAAMSIGKLKGNETIPPTDCSLLHLGESFRENHLLVTPFLPGIRLVIMPWSSSFLSRDNTLHNKASEEQDSLCNSCKTPGYKQTVPPSISDLTLNPAPGEEFDITMAVADDLLNPVNATVAVKIQSNSDSVLMVHSGNLYRKKELTYITSKPLRQLALYGPIGAYGSILFTVLPLRRYKKLQMAVRFRLRNCHLGFNRPMIETVEEAWQFINNSSKTVLLEKVQERLSCRCLTEKAGVIKCKSGKVVQINSQYWAGSMHNENIPDPTTWEKDGKWQYTKEEFINESNWTPDRLRDGQFAVSWCRNKFCAEHNGRPYWTLLTDQPCRAGFNHRGLLCGKCAEGYHFNAANYRCSPCENGEMNIIVYFLLLMAVLAIVFVLLLLLNIAVTPVIDSWIFFCVASNYILSRPNLLVGDMTNNVLTVGLANLCIRERITTLEAVALYLIPPTILLFYVFTLRTLLKNNSIGQRLQKLARRGSLVQVIWLVVLVSYGAVGSASQNILFCVPLDGKAVFYRDGSIKCFESEHLPYAIIAILIILFFILPLPYLMVSSRAYRWPRFRVLIDEASSIYEPSRRWWVTINLLRRFCLVIIAALSYVESWYYTSLTFFMLILLTTHFAFRPLKRSSTLWKITDINNKIEALFLIILLVASVLSCALAAEPDKFQDSFWKAIFLVLYFGPFALALIVELIDFTSGWLHVARRPRSLRTHSTRSDSEEMLTAELLQKQLD